MHVTVSDFYKKRFGQKVYKLSLDGGCTCPTRDGTKGTGGCIFCSARGSGDFTPERSLSITEQLKAAKEIVSGKIKSGKRSLPAFGAATGEEVFRPRYIAYFQNFTNTYGNIKELKEKWNKALDDEEVCGIAIATRPDCLGQEVLKALKELCNRTFVQVELGLQTESEKSADYIRRGFTDQVYVQAVKALHQVSPELHVVTHIIFGLPGENERQMMDSVSFACRSGTDGIKITVLYVLKGTDLEKDYNKGDFELPDMDEYMALIEQALKIMPEKVVIHRLTGDPPKALLVAPQWTADKKRVLNKIKGLLQSE